RNNPTLDSDDTLQLLAAVSPATASNKAVSWKSSNPKVATVDTNGKVIAVGAGTAEITVTTAEGGYHATCMVTVTKQESPLILNVRIPEWIELGKNNPGVSILATVENGQNTTFQWYKDENPIANETSATLYVSGEMGVGSYYVTVSADGGATYAKSNVCRVEWSANEGTVVVIVDQPVSAPPATLDDPKAVADAVLIEDEKQLLKDTNVNLTLTLKVVAQPQPPKQDENAVLHVVDHENAELGMFLDIQLLKEIMDETGKILLSDNVMQATQKLRITIEIPEDLRGHESYFIVRVHDGKTDILVDLDTDPNTITFETDRFSTYALVYESHNSSGGNTNADAGTSDATARSTPQTGDDSSQMLAVYSLLSIISGICIWVALMRKKRGWKR
ncbi:MAG: Ig-like domain-containing protein, partial [Christensenellaceae bacterium]